MIRNTIRLLCLRRLIWATGLLAFCSCFVPSQSGAGRGIPLQERKLCPYDTDNPVAHRVLHSSGQSWLALQAGRGDFDLRLNAYTGFDARTVLFSETLQLRDLSSDSILLLPLPTEAPLFALEVAAYTPGGSGYPWFYDVVWVNRLQDNDQAIYAERPDGSPLLRRYVHTGETFELQYKNDSFRVLYLKYFNKFGEPASPPHGSDMALFNPLTGYQKMLQLPLNKPVSLPEEGVYFVQTDTASNKGAFLLCTDTDFPRLTRLNDLLLSMRYITKNAEYDKMLQGEDRKRELDEFWLARHSDKEVARRQLKLYFNRVMAANRFFSFNNQGWRSDRGLIYIIFGKPDAVYKYSNREIWQYEAAGQRPAIEWVFNRTGEQYLLDRYHEARSVWAIQIEQWRRGLAK